jgi:hypothetical protein
MTDLALQPPAAAPWLRSAVGGTAQAALATYRLGGKALIAAPLLIAIAVVPELAQHIAEISLGMFNSREAFHAGADDPLRWTFAYPKVIGFVLATLGIARFWALGSVRAALLVRPAALLRIAFAFALTLIAEQAFAWLKAISDSPALNELLGGASLLVQAGLLVLLVAALVEDRTTGLRAAFTSRWPTAMLIILLGAVAFVPAQAAHSFHHLAALGQPAPLVWALMLWDSLWVGLMAALAGSALFVAYRAGPTWRGWTVNPHTIG